MRGRPLRIVVFLAGVFLLKLVVVLQLKDHPLTQPDVGLDTSAYVELARRVLDGDLGLGPGLYYLSPLYIYFLAAALAATDSFTAVRVLQILLGTAAVGFIFLMTRAWFNERAAWIAAILAALTGLLTFYEVLLFQASLDSFLTAAALLCLTLALRGGGRLRATGDRLRAAGGRLQAAGDRLRATGGRHRATTPEVQRPRLPWFVLTGVAFGVATLNRPNMLAAAAGIVAAFLIARRIRPAVLVAGGLVIGMSPAAIRNVVVADQWSLLSSHGGLNFYIGNSETATGFYHQVPGITPNISGQQRDARRIAERALGRSVTDAEASDYFFDLAWSWIRREPLATLKLFGRKLYFVFNAQHIALPYSYPFYAHDAKTILGFLVVGPWLLVPLGLAGLMFAAPSISRPSTIARGVLSEVEGRRDYLIWLSFVPAYAIAVALFFVAERYRLPLLVPLAVGSGAAGDAFARMLAARQYRALLAPVAVLVIVAALANWRHGLHDGRWEEGLRMAQRLIILGRYDEADAWARRLEPNALHRGALHYGVGMQYLVANQPARALEYLRQAQQIDPGQANVEYALGQALLQNGQAKEAIPHLKRGFDGKAEMPVVGYDLAVALERTGDLQGAADVVRRIDPGDTDDVEVWLRLGRLAMQVKAPGVAEPFFRRAVQLQPGQAATRQQLGLNLLLLGRFDECARELGEAARLNPRDPESLAHLAYCEVKLGRLDAARGHIHSTLALKPDHALAKQLLAALGK